MLSPLCLGLHLLVTATPTPPPESFFHQYAQTRGFSSGRPVSPRLTPDGKTVLFLRGQARSPVQTLFALDVATGQTRELLTPDALLKGAQQTLSAEEKARLERQRISARGFTGFTLSKDGKLALVTLSGRPYVVELATAKVTSLKADETLDPKLSPDGTRLAYVRENDVFVTDLASGKEHRLTTGGTARLSHGLAEFVAQEEMARFSGYWWSADGRSILYEESDTREVETFSIVDPMNPQNGAVTVPYPRAGKANAKVRLGLVSADGGATRWVTWDAAKYPYVASVKWAEEGPLTVLVQNRNQTEQQLLQVDANTGKTRTLLTEADPAWLELDGDFPQWLPTGAGFLWSTERNGEAEVELRGADGTFKETWLGKDAHYQSFVGLDAPTRTLYFNATPDPTQSVLMRATPGQKPERVLPEGSGPKREVAIWGKDRRHLFVLGASLTTSGQTWELVQTDGKHVATLPSLAEKTPFLPQVEFKKVGAGEGFYSFLVRPRNFQKGQRLPVIVSVYGGPTANVVQASTANYLPLQWLADQGFLVVGFDNRGTPGRGHAWQRAMKGNFAKVTLDDQVTALQALAKDVPELDLTRVGIYGWSFGGYMAALGVLKRPDIFRAAVAGAPVVDWRDYDTHYTERYLGLPGENPKGYEASSLLTYVDNLKGALLLIHGTADDYVYFFHTLKLSNALFRAGKPHEVLPLSGFTHMVPDPLVSEREWQRIADHFTRNLSGGPPAR